jgi:hypothetical protein
MPLTTAQSNKVLDHLLGKTAYPIPQIFVALSSTTPTLSTAGTEPVIGTGGYARVATTGATWNPASSGQSTNAIDIQFPASTADWASAASFGHFELYDAATGGNRVGFGVIATPKNCQAGDQLTFPAGQLTVTLS